MRKEEADWLNRGGIIFATRPFAWPGLRCRRGKAIVSTGSAGHPERASRAKFGLLRVRTASRRNSPAGVGALRYRQSAGLPLLPRPPARPPGTRRNRDLAIPTPKRRD